MLRSVVLSGATLALHASAMRTSTIVSETLRSAQGITAGCVTSVNNSLYAEYPGGFCPNLRGSA
jgi:hypothetical protein